MNAERKFLFACLIFALVIYAIHAFGLFDLLTDLPHLQTLIRQSGFFGYSLYILLFIIATLLLLPGSILVIAGGIVFGPLLGTLLSLIAATLASSCSFLLARWLGRDLLLKYVGHSNTFQAIEKGIARNGIDFLILTRLIPLFPYNIQNYAYGLTTIAFWPYTLISALTTLPGIVIYTVMASDLANEGITLRFILQLCLAGLALFILVQLAKLYARHKHVDLSASRLVTLAFHDFADLLFLRVGQVQVFEHHVLMRTELAFVVHHRLRVSRCCGSGVCGMGQVSRAKSQGRGNKQCS